MWVIIKDLLFTTNERGVVASLFPIPQGLLGIILQICRSTAFMCVTQNQSSPLKTGRLC